MIPGVALRDHAMISRPALSLDALDRDPSSCYTALFAEKGANFTLPQGTCGHDKHGGFMEEWAGFPLPSPSRKTLLSTDFSGQFGYKVVES